MCVEDRPAVKSSVEPAGIDHAARRADAIRLGPACAVRPPTQVDCRVRRLVAQVHHEGRAAFGEAQRVSHKSVDPKGGLTSTQGDDHSPC
eukprot:992331-Prymnesium_polylepis.1